MNYSCFLGSSAKSVLPPHPPPSSQRAAVASASSGVPSARQPYTALLQSAQRSKSALGHRDVAIEHTPVSSMFSTFEPSKNSDPTPPTGISGVGTVQRLVFSPIVPGTPINPLSSSVAPRSPVSPVRLQAEYSDDDEADAELASVISRSAAPAQNVALPTLPSEDTSAATAGRGQVVRSSFHVFFCVHSIVYGVWRVACESARSGRASCLNGSSL